MDDNFDFDIGLHMARVKKSFNLTQDDMDKIYTYFKWNLQSLDKRVTEETFQETVFRTTIMTYVASVKQGEQNGK